MVVVVAGVILKQSVNLLDKGVHLTIISEAFCKVSKEAIVVLTAMSVPMQLTGRDSQVKRAGTFLNNRVVS